MKDIAPLCVSPEASLREVMLSINRTGRGVSLVVDGDQRLLGVITDGDVRRAILAGFDLEVSAQMTLDRAANNAQPITAPATTTRSALIELVQTTHVSHVPLLNDLDQVVGLVGLDDLLLEKYGSLSQAVVMAGGFGTRLFPLTDGTPKPMLPVGDRPLMERIIEQLREVGIKQVNIATHYVPEKIIEHFGDGKKFGVEISYITEDRPLGTAGALGLIQPTNEPLLIINGDILTQVDFRALLAYHQEQHADLTVAVHQQNIQVPYGVVECEGSFVQRITEKPTYKYLINAGIYLLDPSVYFFLPKGERYDMTDLIQRLLDEGRTVAAFPICEYWMDIGQPSDYEQAQQQVQDWEKGK